jgi:hypothetical protein
LLFPQALIPIIKYLQEQRAAFEGNKVDKIEINGYTGCERCWIAFIEASCFAES